MERITLRVPATTANLGPGFDSFGCALTLYNVYTFERRESGLEITGCPAEFCNRENLSVRAYDRVTRALGLPEDGLALRVRAEIPVCRGLGSSSAMLAAGALAANALHGSPLSRTELLTLCTELEGHPDNLAPTIFGGLTASMMDGKTPVTARFSLSERLHFVALVPDFPLSTRLARSVLPKTVPFADAVFNVSHAALLLRALETADAPLLRLALDDRLHQPYRRMLIPGCDAVQELAARFGAFCISGAGPTCLCITDSGEAAARLAADLPEACPGWQAHCLRADLEGAKQIQEEKA